MVKGISYKNAMIKEIAANSEIEVNPKTPGSWNVDLFYRNDQGIRFHLLQFSLSEDTDKEIHGYIDLNEAKKAGIKKNYIIEIFKETKFDEDKFCGFLQNTLYEIGKEKIKKEIIKFPDSKYVEVF